MQPHTSVFSLSPSALGHAARPVDVARAVDTAIQQCERREREREKEGESAPRACAASTTSRWRRRWELRRAWGATQPRGGPEPFVGGCEEVERAAALEIAREELGGVRVV